MKKLKRKDLLLEHYRLAVQAKVTDKVTGKDILVRVWKPKTMDRLPAYQLLQTMKYVADDLYQYWDPKRIIGPKDGGAVWVNGNPDWGAWDAQFTKRMDYRRSQVDIYVCALLVRPFSEEARKHYEERMGLDVWDRMTLMWDSRQYDEEHGCKPAYGYRFDKKSKSPHKSYDDLYRVINEETDIADGTI